MAYLPVANNSSKTRCISRIAASQVITKKILSRHASIILAGVPFFESSALTKMFVSRTTRRILFPHLFYGLGDIPLNFFRSKVCLDRAYFLHDLESRFAFGDHLLVHLDWDKRSHWFAGTFHHGNIAPKANLAEYFRKSLAYISCADKYGHFCLQFEIMFIVYIVGIIGVLRSFVNCVLRIADYVLQSLAWI